jgi:hypothetical protein
MKIKKIKKHRWGQNDKWLNRVRYRFLKNGGGREFCWNYSIGIFRPFIEKNAFFIEEILFPTACFSSL